MKKQHVDEPKKRCKGCHKHQHKQGGERNKHKHRHRSSMEEVRVPYIVPPPRLGACCYDGLCSIQEECDCLSSGGAFAGVGTKCWQVKCPGDPVGACCLPRSNCMMSSEQNCINMGGLWLGPYTSCRQCNSGMTNAYDVPMAGVGRPTMFGLMSSNAFAPGFSSGPMSANETNSLCGLPSGVGRPCDAVDAGLVQYLPYEGSSDRGPDVNYAFYSGGVPTMPPPSSRNFPSSMQQWGWSPF